MSRPRPSDCEIRILHPLWEKGGALPIHKLTELTGFCPSVVAQLALRAQNKGFLSSHLALSRVPFKRASMCRQVRHYQATPQPSSTIDLPDRFDARAIEEELNHFLRVRLANHPRLLQLLREHLAR